MITHQIVKSNAPLAEPSFESGQSERSGSETAEGGGEITGGGAEDGDGWFAAWGLPAGISDVVHKTTNVVQHTVQQTTEAVSQITWFN